jgi:MarR family transcriptional regulator, organic hydroperoxide resistance regulator
MDEQERHAFISEIMRKNRPLHVLLSSNLIDSLHSLGLSIREYQVLSALYVQGERSLADIAHAISAAPEVTSRVVGRLEAQGCVKREPDPSNRRKLSVSLTKGGLETFETVQEYAEKVIQLTLAQMEESDLQTIMRSTEVWAHADDEIQKRTQKLDPIGHYIREGKRAKEGCLETE